MKPKTEECEIDIKDKREIHAAKWVPLKEVYGGDEPVLLFQNANMFLKGVHRLYTEFLQKENVGSFFEYLSRITMT